MSGTKNVKKSRSQARVAKALNRLMVVWVCLVGIVLSMALVVGYLSWGQRSLQCAATAANTADTATAAGTTTTVANKTC